MEHKTSVIVVGAAGRMGRMIIDCARAEDPPIPVIAAIEAAGHPGIGKPLSELAPGAPKGVILTDTIPGGMVSGAVAIDFSAPASTMNSVGWAESTGNPLVIGTTGLSGDQRARIERAAAQAPIVFAPNMSVGVNILFELARRGIEMAGEGFDIEITEIHHRFKKDAPSGTAARLAEIALEARGGQPTDLRHGREGLTGERTAAEIGMHSLRGGDVVGDHTVTLAALGERIELTHRAHTRETFARGALRAARWAAGREPGLYSMKDVLGL